MPIVCARQGYRHFACTWAAAEHREASDVAKLCAYRVRKARKATAVSRACGRQSNTATESPQFTAKASLGCGTANSKCIAPKPLYTSHPGTGEAPLAELNAGPAFLFEFRVPTKQSVRPAEIVRWMHEAKARIGM